MRRKDDILKLRKNGKSYNEICKELGCSKGIVSYHCGTGQKEKTQCREKKRGWKTWFSKKIDNFKHKLQCDYIKKDALNWKGALHHKILLFITKNPKHNKKETKMTKEINTITVLNKIGKNPKCYLTGESIDLSKTSTYHFDHRVPRSQGGLNTLDNLEITIADINQAKGNKTPEEFIELCKKVLKYNGYKITK